MINLKSIIGKFYWNWCSISIARKILVIESDDWGCLRTESINQLKQLNKFSKAVQDDAYLQLDGIAESNDLQALFDVLQSVRDSQGNYAVLTSNVCTANPDFQRIKETEFTQFHYEPFELTISQKADGAQILALWKEGQDNKVFYPQLHGREHLHALAWLKELQRGNKDLRKAFELGAWGIPYQAIHQQRRKNLQAALDLYGLQGEEDFQRIWLRDAVQIFEGFFGFASKTFIPPAYIWHSNIHREFKNLGIESVQGIKLQYQPKAKGYNRKLHFMGQYNSMDKVYFFPRNVFFEPSLLPKMDWYSETLKGIEVAFKNKQPAIIGSHRINFIELGI